MIPLRESLRVASHQFAELRAELTRLLHETLPAFEAELEEVGAPWTPGRELPKP